MVTTPTITCERRVTGNDGRFDGAEYGWKEGREEVIRERAVRCERKPSTACKSTKMKMANPSLYARSRFEVNTTLAWDLEKASPQRTFREWSPSCCRWHRFQVRR